MTPGGIWGVHATSRREASRLPVSCVGDAPREVWGAWGSSAQGGVWRLGERQTQEGAQGRDQSFKRQ